MTDVALTQLPQNPINRDIDAAVYDELQIVYKALRELEQICKDQQLLIEALQAEI